MSKTRIAFCILATACWLLAALPLPAQVADGIGVNVDIGNATLMHRPAVMYPPEARSKNIQGTVVIEVTLDSGGNVADLHVVSGPDELRRAVMASVLQWHFAHEGAGAKRQISVAFKAPAPNPQGVPGGVTGGIVGGVPGGVRQPPSLNMPRVKSIEILGLPDQAKNELMASLPVHEGDVPTIETFSKLSAAIKQFDEHLTMSLMGRPDGTEIRIAAPGAVMPASRELAPRIVSESAPPVGIKVDGAVQASKLVRHGAPVYPALAKQARISGTVRLQAVIAKDGSVANLTVISGHPLLVQAALDAVRNWAYQPTLLNGNPTEVTTEITVNFTLADAPPEQ